MRMREASHEADFTYEPVRADFGGDIPPQDLHRDLPAVPNVVREVHRRHATLAEFSLDVVTARKSTAEGIQLIDHVQFQSP